ncbi:penicillin acylase family protein [Hamadaea flava]|uniref:Penicillin acylase family protein n=1 Tax=Hamadaea flava TaxID=1742688 RepID=A0ABV8LTK4_9ACTN|nr:penicillin acylase family protein [Hamadaea flava]
MSRSRVWLRRARKISLWTLAVVIVLGLVGAGTLVWSIRRALPQLDGTIALPGLSAEVRVQRDAHGVPQIYATTTADLYRAQGYVHAQDRFWEMDFRRHVTGGRLAELFGESQLETDAYLRTMGWRRVAEQEWDLISADSRANLTAYAEGVNAYLAGHSAGQLSLEYTLLSLQNSGYEIEQWDPIDSLAWLKAMAWDLRGNMETEIRRAALLAEGLSVEQIEQLYPAYPYDRNVPIVSGGEATGTPPTQPAVKPTSAQGDLLRELADGLDRMPQLMGDGGPGIGSNSWVISGDLTATGKPILANDPHLSPSQPGIWYQIGLHCACDAQSQDVAGFSFSGVPGVVIGHNARIAWGFTNLDPDVTDLYYEKVTGDQYEVDGQLKPLATRQEVLKIAGGGRKTITVRSTGHGPLLSDASDDLKKLSKDGYAVALRWTALDPGRTADALFALNKAGNWTEFRAAAALFEVPAQNMVYADVDGNIGYQSPGRIPVRGKGDGRWPAPGWDSAYDWTGYLPFAELPTVLNPKQGYVATANQAVIGPRYQHFLTSDWSYGYRSQRINDMIQATAKAGKITLDDVQKMQFDNRNGFAPTLVPWLARTAPDAAKQAVRLLDGWDYQQPEDSAAAAYYNAVWRNLLRLVFDELGYGDDGYPADGGDRWFEVVRHLLDQPEAAWWDVKSTAGHETREQILAQAQADAVAELTEDQDKDPKKWRWGAMHTLTATHATFGTSGIGPIEWLFNHEKTGVSGGDSIVNATGWTAGEGYEVDAVPSMRMIVNLSNLDDSRWIQLTGNSGHAFATTYDDQYERWRTGQTLPFRFARASIDAATEHTLTLTTQDRPKG